METSTTRRPAFTMLPRVAGSVSFIYVNFGRISQDSTGVLVEGTRESTTERTYLPVAALTCVLAGPGVSITTPAIATMARHGASLLVVGEHGVRLYAHGHGETRSARWAQAQATLWGDRRTRTECARELYGRRFPDLDVQGLAVDQLRGLEGHRMKAVYQQQARLHKVTGWKRRYKPEDWSDQDPVNQALSAANACLYGVCHAAIVSLGALPQLGFIHTGLSHSFVFDIADLYKTETSIPVAFACTHEPDPASAARRMMRDKFTDLNLLGSAASNVISLLTPGLKDSDAVGLWSTDQVVDQGTNYGERLC